jgi:hypothetical protein
MANIICDKCGFVWGRLDISSTMPPHPCLFSKTEEYKNKVKKIKEKLQLPFNFNSNNKKSTIHLNDKIIEYLKKHPNSTPGDMCKEWNINCSGKMSSISQACKEMTKEGILVSSEKELEYKHPKGYVISYPCYSVKE